MNFKKFDEVELYTGGLEKSLQVIRYRNMEGNTTRFHLCNAYTLALSRTNPFLKDSLSNSDLNLPDGRPLAFLLSPLNNIQVRGKILFEQIVRDTEFRKKKHFFYGIQDHDFEIFRRCLSKIFADNSDFRVLAAPYDSLEKLNLQELKDSLIEFRPDFLWIGLGTPKQDFLVDIVANWELNALTIIPIGAAFDFIMGKTSEAPKILQIMGLEWLYRWFKEPRRLTKRYTKYNVIFLYQTGLFFFTFSRTFVNRFQFFK